MSDPVPVTWVRPRRPAGRPRPSGLSTRVAVGITVFGLVTALALALGAVAVQRYEARMRASGLETTATVKEILRLKGGGYNATVGFATTDGRPIVARLDDFPREPLLHAGDQLRIRYDPDRPDVTLWDVRDPPDFTGATIFMAALAAAFALGSILFFTITRRRRRRAR